MGRRLGLGKNNHLTYASLALNPRVLVEKQENLFEPAHDKTDNKTCVTSKDSDQHVHPSRIASVLVYSCLNSLEAVEGTCDQRRL